MDDTLREQAKQYSKEKGVEVAFEFINQTDLPTKTAAAVESGAGPDIITTWSDGAHLHNKALIDVSDVAENLGKQLKGWTNIGHDIGFVGKVWKAVPWGIIPICVTYRTDWCKEVGYEKFPDTYDELLVMSKKLKDKGHPVRFARQTIGDGNQSHYPVWASAGRGKADGKRQHQHPETARGGLPAQPSRTVRRGHPVLGRLQQQPGISRRGRLGDRQRRQHLLGGAEERPAAS
jgi:multiple sugar transport system substrate-binding protein